MTLETLTILHQSNSDNHSLTCEVSSSLTEFRTNLPISHSLFRNLILNNHNLHVLQFNNSLFKFRDTVLTSAYTHKHTLSTSPHHHFCCFFFNLLSLTLSLSIDFMNWLDPSESSLDVENPSKVTSFSTLRICWMFFSFIATSVSTTLA